MGLKIWAICINFQVINHFSHLNPYLKFFAITIPLFALVGFSLAITGMVKRALNPCYIDIDARGISLTDLGKTERYEWADLGQPQLSAYRSVGFGDSSCIKLQDNKTGKIITIILIDYLNRSMLADDIMDAYSGKIFGLIKPPQSQSNKSREKNRQQAKFVVIGIFIVLAFAFVKFITNH
jgi:hypothetical protein